MPYGNLATSYRGTVAFSSSDTNASYPPVYTFTTGDQGSHAFNGNLIMRLSGSQLISVADTNNTSLGSSATIVAINPAPLNAFRLSAPSTATSESAFNLGIAGLDVFGNIANTYTGTVRLISSDPNGSPSSTTPFNFVFTSGAAVQRSVSGVTLNSGGNQTLTARDPNNVALLAGQANVFVNSLPAASLYLSGFPGTLVAGQQGNIVVAAYDSYGNIATTYASTIHFTSTDPCAALPPDYQFIAADQGVHQFASLSLHTVNSNQAIMATDANAIGGAQGAIVVTSASPNYLRLTGPATSVAGSPFTVTATAFDVYGNIASGYAGVINFTSSNANAPRPNAYPFVNSDMGTHTFTNGVTIYLSGNQNVKITDSNARSSTLSLVVASSNANYMVLTAPASSVAGAPMTLTLSAYDVYGNLATTMRDNINFTSNDSNGTMPPAYNFSTGDAGTHSFNSNTGPAHIRNDHSYCHRHQRQLSGECWPNKCHGEPQRYHRVFRQRSGVGAADDSFQCHGDHPRLLRQPGAELHRHDQSHLHRRQRRTAAQPCSGPQRHGFQQRKYHNQQSAPKNSGITDAFSPRRQSIELGRISQYERASASFHRQL